MTWRGASSRPGSGDRVGLPGWLWLPASIGCAFLFLPVAGMLAGLDWRNFGALVTSPDAVTALLLSLRTASVATLLCLILGIPLALLLARTRFVGRSLVRVLVLLPLVLPPVVAGIALLATFGRQGLLGRSLEVAGFSIAFSTTAVVIAQTFVALPFLVISLEGALLTFGNRYERVAATLGAGPGVVLRRVTLPVLAPAIVSGAVLSFARALGEFGATITFAGSLSGTTRTLPLEIYLQREVDPDAAVALSVVLVALAIAVLALARGALRRSVIS